MNRYELLKQNYNLVFQFVKNGILSYQIIRDMKIYEDFIESEITTNQNKYLILGDLNELSTHRIEQIVNSMNKNIEE